ncbi:MAG: hypothetical protein ACRCZF_04325 [Gemmataceae bacterium]
MITTEFELALRCPFDYTHQATLSRDDQELRCNQCAVLFPIKLGTPSFIARECTVPEQTEEFSQLPCQRRRNRAKSR